MNETLALYAQDEKTIEEVLLCIQNMESYFKMNVEELNCLCLNLKNGFQSDDYDIKNLSIELFSILLSTSKEEDILQLLISDCKEITLSEFRGYYQLIQKIDVEMKEKMNNVIMLLKEHNNYFIRKNAIEKW